MLTLSLLLALSFLLHLALWCRVCARVTELEVWRTECEERRERGLARMREVLDPFAKLGGMDAALGTSDRNRGVQ